MPLPNHIDEADRLGAFLGRPIETVRCKTIDLEAPASAEILIEGHLSLGQPQGERMPLNGEEPALSTRDAVDPTGRRTRRGYADGPHAVSRRRPAAVD
jgi:4-hydroxy-3-polyprenylbenzoate decarboxylase